MGPSGVGKDGARTRNKKNRERERQLRVRPILGGAVVGAGCSRQGLADLLSFYPSWSWEGEMVVGIRRKALIGLFLTTPSYTILLGPYST